MTVVEGTGVQKRGGVKTQNDLNAWQKLQFQNKESLLLTTRLNNFFVFFFPFTLPRKVTLGESLAQVSMLQTKVPPLLLDKRNSFSSETEFPEKIS